MCGNHVLIAPFVQLKLSSLAFNGAGSSVDAAAAGLATCSRNTELQNSASLHHVRTMEHADRRLSFMDLNDDVMIEICNAVALLSKTHPPLRYSQEETILQRFSMTCRRIRRLAAPRLFYGIKIGPHGWNLTRAHDALDSLERCNHIRAYTRAFHFELYPERGTAENRNLPSRFANILANMKKLDRVVFSVPECQHTSSRFQTMLKAMKVILGTVQRLRLPTGSHWMINCCPNVKSLCIGPTGEVLLESIIKDSSLAFSHLQHFEMPAHWDTKTLSLILKAMPQLHTLAMTRGMLHYRDGIPKMVPVLAEFPKLKTLVLASVANLGVGFSIPNGGGAYNGHVRVGPLPTNEIPRERLKAVQYVADLVFQQCPNLETIWIGDDYKAVRPQRTEGGQRSLAILNERRKWPAPG